MEHVLPIDEVIVRISPNTYSDTLQTCLDNYEQLSEQIISALTQVLLHIPGSFIHLTLIFDLSVKNKKIAEDLKNKMMQNLSESKDLNCITNILFNIFYLEKLHFFQEQVFAKLASENNLNKLYDIFNTTEAYKKIVDQLNIKGSEYLDLDSADITFDENIKKELKDFCDSYSENQKIFANMNCDSILVIQTMKSLQFSVNDCKFFLVNHFSHKNFLQLLYGMFLMYQETEKSFLLCLFLELSKFEGFLSTFYNTFYELKSDLKNSNKTDCLLFMNTVMALLYEKYYFPTNEMSSAYKESCAYDPLYARAEKEDFMRLIDADITNLMCRFSQKDYLKKNLPTRLHEHIQNEKEFDKSDTTLKTLIKTGQYDKIKQIPKDELFKAFFYISKDSISHFLTYLEALKELFVLTKYEQAMFCDQFLEFFETHETYKRFVSKKLALYKIIDKDVQEKYVTLFANQ